MVSICLICLLAGCSSRGVAPVYNRGHTTVPTQKSQRPRTYTIKAGDTLYSIAWRYGVNHYSLAAWNGIKGPGFEIYPGTVLRLFPPSDNRPRDQKRRQQTKKPVKVNKSAPTLVAKAPPPPAKPVVNSKIKNPRGGNLKLDWLWPTKGRVVQTFTTNDPARNGVKISGHAGQSIVAAESGKVVYSGSGLVGYGNLIIIKHDNNYLSAYGYNKKLLVKEGDSVVKGEVIAHMGSVRNDTEPMLHFEIRKHGKPIDPLSVMDKN